MRWYNRVIDWYPADLVGIQLIKRKGRDEIKLKMCYCVLFYTKVYA